MSTTTPQSSSLRFIIAAQNTHDGLSKLGFVTLNKRCIADEAIKTTFPPNTKGYEEVLKSCRWLATQDAATSVDWTYGNLKLKTIKL